MREGRRTLCLRIMPHWLRNRRTILVKRGRSCTFLLFARFYSHGQVRIGVWMWMNMGIEMSIIHVVVNGWYKEGRVLRYRRRS